MKRFEFISYHDKTIQPITDKYGYEGYGKFMAVIDYCEEFEIYEISIEDLSKALKTNRRGAATLYPMFSECLTKVWAKFTQSLPKVSPNFDQSLPKLEAQNPHGSTQACARAIDDDEDYSSSSLPPQRESEAFKTFMKSYPKGKNRKDAWEQWHVNNLDNWLEEILDSLSSYKKCADWEKEAGRYIPQAAKFLEDELWTYPAPLPALKLAPEPVQKMKHVDVLMGAKAIYNWHDPSIVIQTADIKRDKFDYLYYQGEQLCLSEFKPVEEAASA